MPLSRPPLPAHRRGCYAGLPQAVFGRRGRAAKGSERQQSGSKVVRTRDGPPAADQGATGAGAQGLSAPEGAASSARHRPRWPTQRCQGDPAAGGASLPGLDEGHSRDARRDCQAQGLSSLAAAGPARPSIPTSPQPRHTPSSSSAIPQGLNPTLSPPGAQGRYAPNTQKMSGKKKEEVGPVGQTVHRHLQKQTNNKQRRPTSPLLELQNPTLFE